MTAGYKRTDVGVIPMDWDVRRVAEMGDVRAGKALAVSAIGEPRPYLRTKNVFDGRIDLDDVLTMPMTAVDFARYQLRSGDVLLNEGQSLELVGRCAVYRGEHPDACAIQNQLVRFRARNGVSAEFAAQLFRRCQQTGAFTRIALQTTSVAHLGVSRFAQLKLAWPSDPQEQASIGNALRDADALIESLEQLLAKKRHLKQGAMQELLTGKKRLPGFESGCGHRQTELGALPSDWVVATLGAITTKIGSGVTPTGGASRYKLHGRAFVRSQNVGWGELRLDDLAFIDEDTHASFSATELVADDVLLNITGASIGRSTLASARVTGGNVNQHVCIVRLDPDKAAPWLINLLLLSDLGQRQIAAFQAGGNRQGLNFAQVASMKVPLSRSLLEQEAIARVVTDLSAEIGALEAKLTKARQIKQGMMQELLTGRIRLV